VDTGSIPTLVRPHAVMPDAIHVRTSCIERQLSGSPADRLSDSFSGVRTAPQMGLTRLVSQLAARVPWPSDADVGQVARIGCGASYGGNPVPGVQPIFFFLN